MPRWKETTYAITDKEKFRKGKIVVAIGIIFFFLGLILVLLQAIPTMTYHCEP